MIMSGDGAYPQICLNNIYNGYDLFDLMIIRFHILLPFVKEKEKRRRKKKSARVMRET